MILVDIIAISRIGFAMARDGLLPQRLAAVHPTYATPGLFTLLSVALIAVLATFVPIEQLAEMVSIGTLFAFALVCIGVLVLRVTEPERPRPFRVPLVWVVAPLGAIACAFIMHGLPKQAWERFGIWLVIGIALYFAYGFWNSRLRKPEPQ